jgi:hypothetical protein
VHNCRINKTILNVFLIEESLLRLPRSRRQSNKKLFFPHCSTHTPRSRRTYGKHTIHIPFLFHPWREERKARNKENFLAIDFSVSVLFFLLSFIPSMPFYLYSLTWRSGGGGGGGGRSEWLVWVYTLDGSVENEFVVCMEVWRDKRRSWREREREREREKGEKAVAA